MRRWLSYFMKSIWILLLICGVVGSVISLAQSGDRSDLPPGYVYPPVVWPFYVRGVGYSASIDRQSVLAAPTWSPSQPLPLDFARVEEIARRELRRFVDNDAAWRLPPLVCTASDCQIHHGGSMLSSSRQPALAIPIGMPTTSRFVLMLRASPAHVAPLLARSNNSELRP